MNKNESTKWAGILGRVMLAYALVFAQGAWATQNQGTKDKSGSARTVAAQQANEKRPSAAATTLLAQTKQAQGEESESAAAEEKPSGDGRHEGIKVHGHWTIEVRNPDGMLVTHRQFENSLDPANGNSVLTTLLARQATVSHWQIGLAALSNAGPCLDNAGQPTLCIIAEAEPSGACPSTNLGLLCPSSNVFPTLNVPTLNANGNLVLSGQATAAISSSIITVSTGLRLCNPTISPASIPCPGTIGQAVKGFTIAIAIPGSPQSPGFTTPIPVSPGQLIAVTVVISFS